MIANKGVLTNFGGDQSNNDEDIIIHDEEWSVNELLNICYGLHYYNVSNDYNSNVTSTIGLLLCSAQHFKM